LFRVECMVFVGNAGSIDTSSKNFPNSRASKRVIDFRFMEYRKAEADCPRAGDHIEYLGIRGREVSRQLHLSPSAVSKLLQRG